MADLLLIDWDDHEARLLTGSTSGGGLRVEKALAAPVEGDASPNTIAAALRPILANLSHGKRNVVLVLGGRDVQSRLLRVPPVPTDELPDLVRLRASTEFPIADDAAAIDFLPIDEQAGQPITVFAARMTAKTIAAAREVCNKLHVSPDSITMRGCGVAILAAAHNRPANVGVGLLIVRRGTELDLVGTLNDRLALVRSVSLASDSNADSLGPAAAREIRRTLAAITSELVASHVDSTTWVVGDETDKQLADYCSRGLPRQIQQVEYADLVSSDVAWPDGAVAFAGMNGMGLALAKRKLPIDFLSPRKPAEKPTPVRAYALAAALAALVFLGGGWLSYSKVASLERAAAADIEERQVVDSDVEKLADEVRNSRDVEQWLATDVNWLDEIDRIATTLRPEPLDNHDEFQPDRDVVLSLLSAKKAAAKRGVGGTIELDGGVRDEDVLENLENQLRGPGRQVNPKTLIKDSEEAPYIWAFRAEVVVTPDLEGRQ